MHYHSNSSLVLKKNFQSKYKKIYIQNKRCSKCKSNLGKQEN